MFIAVQAVIKICSFSRHRNWFMFFSLRVTLPYWSTRPDFLCSPDHFRPASELPGILNRFHWHLTLFFEENWT